MALNEKERLMLKEIEEMHPLDKKDFLEAL